MGKYPKRNGCSSTKSFALPILRKLHPEQNNIIMFIKNIKTDSTNTKIKSLTKEKTITRIG
ncbi:MAG: hypothetical protein IPO78_16915 [Saprospiraceae bacterium]|nr:hypothetical protein [Saprospiraceae bacterium]